MRADLIKKKTRAAFTSITSQMRDTAAFTLTEVLATVIVVGLVSAGLATAVTVGARQFSNSMALSESQMLLAALEQDIENDLKYATILYSDEDSDVIVGYASGLHANEQGKALKLMALDDNGDVIEPDEEGYITGVGQLALCSKDLVVKNRLLGTGAYNYGLKARVEELKYDRSAKYFTLKVAVYADSAGGSIARGEEISIKSLNAISVIPFE